MAISTQMTSYSEISMIDLDITQTLDRDGETKYNCYIDFGDR